MALFKHGSLAFQTEPWSSTLSPELDVDCIMNNHTNLNYRNERFLLPQTFWTKGPIKLATKMQLKLSCTVYLP